jgi:hypothetical protein
MILVPVRPLAAVVSATALALVTIVVGAGADGLPDRSKKPSFGLKATPATSFSPSRIFLLAELKGGPNDYEDYYCPTVEWDWDDGTESVAKADCDPYEAGKSEIKRRFVIEHIYKRAGEYRVRVRLKRSDRVVVAATAVVTVHPGLRDPG